MAKKLFSYSIAVEEEYIDAFAKAIAPLMSRMRSFALVVSQEIEDAAPPVEVVGPEPLFSPEPEWRRLAMSARARNALRLAGVKTLHEIEDTPDHVLIRLPNTGRGTVREIREAVRVARAPEGRG